MGMRRRQRLWKLPSIDPSQSSTPSEPPTPPIAARPESRHRHDSESLLVAEFIFYVGNGRFDLANTDRPLSSVRQGQSGKVSRVRGRPSAPDHVHRLAIDVRRIGNFVPVVDQPPRERDQHGGDRWNRIGVGNLGLDVFPAGPAACQAIAWIRRWCACQPGQQQLDPDDRMEPARPFDGVDDLGSDVVASNNPANGQQEVDRQAVSQAAILRRSVSRSINSESSVTRPPTS